MFCFLCFFAFLLASLFLCFVTSPTTNYNKNNKNKNNKNIRITRTNATRASKRGSQGCSKPTLRTLQGEFSAVSSAIYNRGSFFQSVRPIYQKRTTPWHWRGFSSLGLWIWNILESGMSTRLLVLLLFYSDFCFNNDYCYHHDQVNIQTKLCNISTSAFKAIIFSLALLCLSSAAVLRFEELAQLLQPRQQVTWTLVANSLKVVRNVITPPHPPPWAEARMCKIHVNNGNKWNAQKRSMQQLYGKTAACLEALAPITTNNNPWDPRPTTDKHRPTKTQQ